ncbi:MAG: anaerobic ribonucleoside-triphosphate reductase activating protein [Lachnospiraceae bacterium]|nr:anaerobic ribonucleoside-triphosphate reductase activating protein [Lachnospiraceae bacterium]
MRLCGLQKMTLLDYPEHVACTVFLGGCDLRCPFCHNFELADGSAEPVMDEEAFFLFLEKRKGLLDGVAVSGGEPCLYRELPAFLGRIRRMGYLVKLDTNGCHPQMLRQILEEHLADRIAMDVKNSPEKYAQTTGIPGFDTAPVLESIALLASCDAEVEFRTTVVREFHDEQDFHAIGRMLAGAENYFLQAFIPRDTVPDKDLHAPTSEEMHQYEQIAKRYIPNARIRGSE